MYKRAQSTHKLPVHSAKGFANFSASLAMLPPTCPFLLPYIAFAHINKHHKVFARATLLVVCKSLHPNHLPPIDEIPLPVPIIQVGCCFHCIHQVVLNKSDF
jgi:hypothetical protein